MAKLEQELDSAIWSKATYDILVNIVEQSDLPTQISWSCTSRTMFPIASSKIWASLRVRSSEITAYNLIVHGHRFTDRSDGIIHFLLESAYRRHNKWTHILESDASGTFIHQPHGIETFVHRQQLTLTLPVSRVKHLEIDNQGFDDQHPKCDQINMDCLLPILLKRLSLLQSFKYIGPLSSQGLAAVVQVDRLRVLHVRSGIEVLKVQSNPAGVTEPWIDSILDWSVLVNLRGLESLQIGRLQDQEVRELATAVTSLKLRRLYLSCWGWEFEDIDPSMSWGATSHTSALVLFLDALMTLDLDDDRKLHGLPSTLQHLVLVDKYHAWIPSLHQLIARAILPCEDLKSLSTTISVNGQCYDQISKMGLPAYHKMVGLRTWKQLSCDEGMKVLHQYRRPSAETLLTNPYPRLLNNMVKSLDQVLAGVEGPADYRMSMHFVKQDQFRNDEILIYPCEGEYGPCAAEIGPQARDADMMDLVNRFGYYSLEETQLARLLRCWGVWPL